VEIIPLYAIWLVLLPMKGNKGRGNYRGMLLAPPFINKFIMKKIYSFLFLIIILVGCKSTFSIAMNPDKSTFNSGTIGSVRATDHIANTKTGLINYNDTSLIKKDSLYRDFRVVN
jgi:hypothetical protein